jgi:hypothetical protein
MNDRARETRDSVVLGHRLEVSPSADGRWGVTVDGARIAKTFVNAYAAWAVGAAESYRQGPVAGTPPVHD